MRARHHRAHPEAQHGLSGSLERREPREVRAVGSTEGGLLDLQRRVGNRAVTELLARNVSVQRTNAVVSPNGMVGEDPGALVNAESDVRLALERLIHLNSITVPDHDTVWAALKKRNDAIARMPLQDQQAARKKPVAVADLGPLLSALARNAEGSINPGVAQWQLGVRIDKSVGPGLDNLPADVDMLAQALQYEGLATSVTSSSASKLPAVIAGLSDLKNRILTGVRPEGPRVPGGLDAAKSNDFTKVSKTLGEALKVPGSHPAGMADVAGVGCVTDCCADRILGGRHLCTDCIQPLQNRCAAGRRISLWINTSCSVPPGHLLHP